METRRLVWGRSYGEQERGGIAEQVSWREAVQHTGTGEPADQPVHLAEWATGTPLPNQKNKSSERQLPFI